ncbi:hypothetical protein KFL_004140010 [Klebsormidium nitens]|uniref:Uncharacterized protein n=1 Tax=Klebsormidium nitens TaxID=105231 RepID=A0A0U9HL82_KLENI|nr:hypothetical protein KFL_004140010 [Klebsormidium nitens]|eukprot:GAQ88265.1 hypothetical protein KFL_004140010 [Klebsormidium nitens]
MQEVQVSRRARPDRVAPLEFHNELRVGHEHDTSNASRRDALPRSAIKLVARASRGFLTNSKRDHRIF